MIATGSQKKPKVSLEYLILSGALMGNSLPWSARNLKTLSELGCRNTQSKKSRIIKVMLLLFILKILIELSMN